jgi:UDP-glucose 4-epimerase|tara:strand:+ start:633 stop:1622 length:990 start_codon:yes stop_codon:yes gene_type:complete
MRILITGGAGFIGSHLVDYLISKKNIKKVIVLDNVKDGSLKNLKKSIKSKKFSFYKKDIRNFNNIKNIFKNVDIVYHFAALSDVVPSIEEPIEYLDTNIMGTVNVLEAMRKNNIKKIIYAASSSCYGIPKKFPTTENEEIKPMYPYALSKNLGEQVIKHWSKTYKIEFVSLRLFNVYGTRSRTNSAYGAALGVFLKQKLSNYPFTIIGNGKQKRDFIHVDDVVKAFYLSINKSAKNIILNIGSGNPRSVLEMANILKGKKIFISKRPGEPDITHAKIDKAKFTLKWKPEISLEEGLDSVLKNIFYWKKAPLWTRNKIKLATKNWFKYLK